MTFDFPTKQPKNATTVNLTSGKLTKFVETKNGDELRVGAGEGTLSRRKAVLLARKVLLTAKQNRLGQISIVWSDWRVRSTKEVSDHDLGELIAVAFCMAGFEFTTYKTKGKDYFAGTARASVIGAPKTAQAGFTRGTRIGAEVNACRALANTPGGDMTPDALAKAAQQAVKGTMAKVTVLNVAHMKKLGMGAVLGVGKGSDAPPRFIVMEYWGAGKKAKKQPLVLIGKGVTFDSGGLNIKPGDHMYEMHMDMSGGAAVIHAVALAARLKVKRNVVGLIPAVENMPGNAAFRPGDILKSMSGKTIEVLNTDAEGRVILADALTYAKRYKPDIVIEASTLTGAVLGALGQQCSAVLSTDRKLEDDLRDLGERSGDYVWPFPLWEEYNYMVEGNFGDVPNIPASGNSRYAGVIGGGKFLEQFVDGYKFAHLDIASRMTAAPGEHLSKGAAGAPVRLFLAAIENL